MNGDLASVGQFPWVTKTQSHALSEYGLLYGTVYGL